MRALAAGELNTYSTEKRYLRADGGEAWVALDVTVVRNADGGPQYFLSQMADIGERRAAEQALAQSEERFRTLAVGLARRRLRHRRGRPPGLRQRAPARDLRHARRGPRRRRRGWSASPPRTASAWSTEFRRARALGERASLDVRVEAGIDRWARIHMAPVIDGRRRSRRASSARSRTSPSRSPPAWRWPRARPSTACWPSTPPTSSRATRSTAPSSTPRPVARAHARLGAPTRCSARRPRSWASTTPRTREIVDRNWVEALRERPPAHRGLPRPAPRRLDRVAGDDPRAPCAAPAARRWRWSASRATSPSARAPSSSSPTARCTTGSPGCPTARCSSTASARRCGARAGASAAWPSSSSTSTASRSSTTRSATRPATACSSTWPCG